MQVRQQQALLRAPGEASAVAAVVQQVPLEASRGSEPAAPEVRVRKGLCGLCPPGVLFCEVVLQVPGEARGGRGGQEQEVPLREQPAKVRSPGGARGRRTMVLQVPFEAAGGSQRQGQEVRVREQPPELRAPGR